MVQCPREKEVIIIFTFNSSLMWQSQFLISSHQTELLFTYKVLLLCHFLEGGDKDNILLLLRTALHMMSPFGEA